MDPVSYAGWVGPQVAQTLWESATLHLQQFLSNTDWFQTLRFVFGPEIDETLALNTLQALISGEERPEIGLVSQVTINGANGAFSATTGVIYLAEEVVAGRSPEAIIAVFLQELGHYLDEQLNPQDAAGDEGALFSSVVRREALTASQIQALRRLLRTNIPTVEGE